METQYHIGDYRLREVVEGGNMPHCNRVHRCVVDTAFRLLELRFPLVEGRPPNGHLPRSRQPHEGSRGRYK